MADFNSASLIALIDNELPHPNFTSLKMGFLHPRKLLEQVTEQDFRVFGIFPIMEIADLWRYIKK
jgi:hypothetical protein